METTKKTNSNESGFKRLTAEEERELGERIMAGDDMARNTLVERSMGLVYTATKKAMTKAKKIRSITYDDLVQEATLGLLEAAERYDYQRGTRFSTMATYWIRKYIEDYIASESTALSVPAGSAGVLKRAKSKADREGRALGEVAAEMGISERTAHQYLTAAESAGSVNSFINTDDGTTVEDVVRENEDVAMEDIVANALLRDELQKTMEEVLTPRERHIIALRFGLADGHPKTPTQLCEEFGMSRSGMSTTEQRALEKMLASRHGSVLAHIMRDSAGG